MLRLEVPLDLAAIGAAQDRIAAWLEGERVPAASAYRVRLVAEELLANLVMHGRFAAGPPPARLEVRAGGGAVDLVIEDAAEPFDPRVTADPALPPSLEDDLVGGLGLPLVRRMAEIRGYHRTEAGWNRTELHIGGASEA